MLHPGLDLAAAHRSERPVTQERVGVHAQVRLGLRCGRRPVELARPPLLGVGLEQRLGVGRVDVDPAGEVAARPVEEALGIGLLREVPRLLRAAGILPPAHPVRAVGPLVDARHDHLHRGLRQSSLLLLW